MGLAVSGGPDSMALLALASELGRDAIAVATVNHGLRPEAADECAMVADACAAWSIPCTILTVTLASGNLQQEARRARYAALEDWARGQGVGVVATAHHADDQAETLLMRLNRGSGVSGLAGIREMQIIGDDYRVIRPLLGFRRAQLQVIAAQAGLATVDDPSNADDHYDRVRMRKALAQADWLDMAAIARSASHLAETDRILEALAVDKWDQRALVSKGEVRVPQSGWLDTDARMLIRAIAHLGGSAGFGDAFNLASRLASGGGKGNIGGVLIEKRADFYLCQPEPPRK
ncbi:MAG: tRNA lysidine(34) synthetase TilS, partial [Pontixanthobacter sp.]